MKTTTQKIVFSSMFGALVCIATMLIKIPSPLNGYINLGDCIVLLCAAYLPAGYGFLAAGIGSALADIFSGYIDYAPATFLIKGAMAIVFWFVSKTLANKIKPGVSKIMGGILAELIMIFGYFVYEGFLYGFVPSLVNIPANAVQGTVGLIVGLLLIKLFDKSKIFS